MKFGKYLASRQLELPEYSSHFIDYKALKKLIKHLAIPTTFNNNSFGETVNISQDEIQTTLKENKASFFFRVERELDKVNSFYLEKQANLAINLDLLMVKYRDVLEKCVASTKYANDSNSESLNSFENSNFRNSISFLNLYQNFKKIHQDLIRLQQFIELNETGFSKVLKKWDKRSKSHTKELFLLTAVNVQPVFHKNEINELSDIVTQSIFDLESIMDGDLSILKNYNPVIGTVPNRLVSSISLTTFNDKEEKIGTDYSGISRHGSIANIENNQIDELYTSFVNIATIKDPDLSLLARWIEKVEGSSEGNKVNKMSKILLLAITNLKISDTFLESFLNLIHYKVEFISIKDNFNNNKNIIHECCSIPPASTYESSHHVVINNGVKIINSVDSINHSRIFLLNHIMSNTPIEKCKDLLIWKDFNGRTCLHYAAQNNRLDILDIILPHFPKENIDDLDNESISALLLAIKYGHFEIMKKLVELGSNCFPNNDKKKLQYLPINYACKYGDFKTIEYLLSHNKPSESFINKQDFEGLLPLHVVAREGHYHLIKLLIDHGAEVNILDGFNKWTPLFYAALEGHVKTTQELVKFGAKLDIIDNDGYNVLYYCIIEGHINVLNEILKIENNILNFSTSNHTFDSKSSMNDIIVTNNSNIEMDESEDSGGLEKNISDSIPDLVLPPPILPLRRYGHNFLEQKIFIELILPDDSELIRLFNSETDLKPGRMTLTSNISDIVPRNIILPLSDNAVLSGNCIFQTDIDSLPEFRIDIEVFPKFGTRLIAKSTLLLMSQITSTSSEIKPILLPLFDLRLRNIGELKFSYQVIFPFSGTLLETSKFDTYWKSSTSYMKNNRILRLNAAGGLSPNDILSPSNIANSSSNNINSAKGDGCDISKMQSSSVVTATSLSGEYLRIRVSLLNDGTPVVCPSWSLSITDSIQLYLPNLSLDQLSSITDNLFDYEKVLYDLSKMCVTDIPLIKKLLRILYMPLSAFLEILSNDININLEIIFPSLFEIRNLPFIGNIQRNLNKFIDNTLTDVFEHTRILKSKNLTPGRSVLFLSSNSLICKVLNWKQPNFPVFLIMNGITYCHISKSFESRTTNGLSKKGIAVQKQHSDSELVDLESIRSSNDIHPEEKTICSIKEAMDFATKNNLIGLVISIHLLDLAPKLVPLIRARGLVLVASCDTTTIEEEFKEGELESYSKNDINGLRFGDILSFKEELAM